MATPIDRAALLDLIELYGQTYHTLAAERTLEKIKALIGPSAADLATRYLAGHSLDAIARQTGMSASTVRQMILSTGTPMRAPGRPRKSGDIR